MSRRSREGVLVHVREYRGKQVYLRYLIHMWILRFEVISVWVTGSITSYFLT